MRDKCQYIPSYCERNCSGLLVACGDSPMLVVDVGFAAAGGKAHIHHKYLRTAVECRFIEHGRPPIYRVDTAGGRSFEKRDLNSYLRTNICLRRRGKDDGKIEVFIYHCSCL